MRKLLVSDTQRASRNIYTEFITGVRQDEGDFPAGQVMPSHDSSDVQTDIVVPQQPTDGARNLSREQQNHSTTRNKRNPQLQSSVVIPENSSLRPATIHCSQVPGHSTVTYDSPRPTSEVGANKNPSLRTFRFHRCIAMNRDPPVPLRVNRDLKSLVTPAGIIIVCKHVLLLNLYTYYHC